MWCILEALVLTLLLVSLIFEKKDNEKFLYYKVGIIYLLNLFTLNLGNIKLPILLFIGYFVINKRSKLNLKIKFKALAFSLIVYILSSYVMPPIDFKNVIGQTDFYKDIHKFEEIMSYQRFSSKYHSESMITDYGDTETQTMFREYVLRERNVPIKSLEWLRYYCPQELDLYWMSSIRKEHYVQQSIENSVQKVDEMQEYIRFNKSREEYLGVYKIGIDGKFYLDYVINGSMKRDLKPKFPF